MGLGHQYGLGSKVGWAEENLGPYLWAYTNGPKNNYSQKFFFFLFKLRPDTIYMGLWPDTIHMGLRPNTIYMGLRPNTILIVTKWAWVMDFGF